MKASELTQRLQSHIDKHGDTDLVFYKLNDVERPVLLEIRDTHIPEVLFGKAAIIEMNFHICLKDKIDG